MKVKKYQSLLTSTLISLFTISINAQETTIEWAPFVKNIATTEQQLIAAAEQVNTEFLSKQKGFIKRELVKKNEQEYADIIYWQNKSDALNAGEKVFTCIKCNEYFKHMNAKEKSGEGFSHYTIIKSW